jgi:hypothetical protein
MKRTGPLFAAFVIVAASGGFFASAAISQQEYGNLAIPEGPTIATVMCRPAMTSDSAAGMAAMHQMEMKGPHGEMVCKSMAPVKTAMADTAAKAKAAGSAGEANTIWIHFLNGQMAIPLPPK